jgi:hypothetical protein
MQHPLACEYAPVAQLDRALVSGTKGRGFESLQAYQVEFTDTKRSIYGTLFVLLFFSSVASVKAIFDLNISDMIL